MIEDEGWSSGIGLPEQILDDRRIAAHEPSDFSLVGSLAEPINYGGSQLDDQQTVKCLGIQEPPEVRQRRRARAVRPVSGALPLVLVRACGCRL